MTIELSLLMKRHTRVSFPISDLHIALLPRFRGHYSTLTEILIGLLCKDYNWELIEGHLMGTLDYNLSANYSVNNKNPRRFAIIFKVDFFKIFNLYTLVLL